MTPIELTALGVPMLGAIVWLLRLEGSIRVLDAHWIDIKDRLSRIEDLLK